MVSNITLFSSFKVTQVTRKSNMSIYLVLFKLTLCRCLEVTFVTGETLTLFHIALSVFVLLWNNAVNETRSNHRGLKIFNFIKPAGNDLNIEKIEKRESVLYSESCNKEYIYHS